MTDILEKAREVASRAAKTPKPTKEPGALTAEQEERRQRVLALIGTQSRVAIVVPDIDCDPVIGTVALRGDGVVTTFDVEMPKAKFDPIKLLKLVHRWGQGKPTPEITRELAVIEGSKDDSKPARPTKSLDPEPEAA